MILNAWLYDLLIPLHVSSSEPLNLLLKCSTVTFFSLTHQTMFKKKTPFCLVKHWFFLYNITSVSWLLQVFVESLLCSSRVENIRLAGQLMHCSKVYSIRRSLADFCSCCPRGSPNIKPLIMNFPFSLISTFVLMFPGQSGCSCQLVFPGKRLCSEGGLWQQRGIGVGCRQRVLQLLYSVNGPLHGPGQVSRDISIF